MCLSSFFQFPFMLIACVEELETTNTTSSTPQDMLNASTKSLPSPILLLTCLLLAIVLIAPNATASPLPEAHHRHTRPFSTWHRTSHVRRDILTTGAELPDIDTDIAPGPVRERYWAISANLPGFAIDREPEANLATAHVRLPRNLFARTYECWRGGKLWTCVMRVLGAKLSSY
jgi:hypothetical protein